MPSVLVKHVLLMLCGSYCWSCCCGSMFCSGCCSWMSPPSCAVLYEPQLVHFIPSTWKGTVQWAWQSLHIICSNDIKKIKINHQTEQISVSYSHLDKCTSILLCYRRPTLTIAPWYSVGIGDWAISLSISFQWFCMSQALCMHSGQR